MFKRISIGKVLLGMSFLLTLVHSFAALADYSPARLSRLLTTQVTHHGPNCWNTTLVGVGLLNHIRFSSAEEFRFLMDSPVCKKISAAELQPGDVQIYFRPKAELSVDQREVHTNIWLSEKKNFNKMTVFATAPYAVTTHDEVNRLYAFTSELVNFNLENPRRLWGCRGEQECRNEREYRRCGSVEEVKRADPQYSTELETALSAIEITLAEQLQKPTRPHPEFVMNLKQGLFVLEQRRQEHCAGSIGFYCEYSRHAIASMQAQLEKTQPAWLPKEEQTP